MQICTRVSMCHFLTCESPGFLTPLFYKNHMLSCPFASSDYCTCSCFVKRIARGMERGWVRRGWNVWRQQGEWSNHISDGSVGPRAIVFSMGRAEQLPKLDCRGSTPVPALCGHSASISRNSGIS